MPEQMNSFDEVVSGIFAKLAIRYGAVWLRQWDGVDMAFVQDDWKDELSGFSSNLEPLRYALRNLPERCPNVTQFKALANQCPAPEFKQLPAPVASKAVVAEQIAKQAGLKHSEDWRDPKSWARRHVANHEAGRWVRPISLQFARQALGIAHA